MNPSWLPLLISQIENKLPPWMESFSSLCRRLRPPINFVIFIFLFEMKASFLVMDRSSFLSLLSGLRALSFNTAAS